MTGRDPRIEHADDVLRRLFPGSTPRWGRPVGPLEGQDRCFAVAPTGRHPRLLVPTAPRGAAAAALRAYGGRLSATGRWGYRGTAWLAAAAGTSLLRSRVVVDASAGDAVDSHLGRLLGQPVAVAVHLTPPRANRKPVLSVLAAGEPTPVAFGKAAVNPLTRRLVDAEASALRRLRDSSPHGFAVPEVLGLADVADVRLLTLSPLPTWAPGRLPTAPEVDRACLGLLESQPRSVVPLATSTFLAGLRRDVAGIAPGAARDRLSSLIDSLVDRYGNAGVELGVSHGDWSPWNMWWTGGELLVWDWERCADDIPVGSDLVHYLLQELLVMRRTPPAAAARAVIEAAPTRLRGVVTDPHDARLTAVLHLLSLATRYEKDGQAAAGSALGETTGWLLPAVEAAVTADAGTR
jgi:hypothetical protein